MPQGAQAIYYDMYCKYGNASADPSVILGVMSNNLVACYLDDFYRESRDFAVAPMLRNPYNFDDPYFGRTGAEIELDGLRRYMKLPDVLAWALARDSPMGFNLQATVGTGAHALTVWGAKYNDVTGALEGVYYTNSDDTVEGDPGTPFVGMKYSGDGNLYTLSGDWVWKREDNRLWKIWEVTMFNPEAFYALSVPEPSAFGLPAGTLALAFCAARRRRRKN